MRTVVNTLSLWVDTRQTLALVGKSGSGKSVTTLSILWLLPSPPVVYPSGDIRLHGESLLRASEQILHGIWGSKVAMILQESIALLNLLHNLERQLYGVLSLHRGMCRETAQVEILTCLDRVGIRQAAERLADYPHQLSSDECQCMMIATVLLTRPEPLTADELVTALDVSVQAQILQLLGGLQRELNMGLLSITRNLGVVKKLADIVTVMQNGQYAEQSRAAQLLAVPTHPYAQKLLDSGPLGDPVPVPAGQALSLKVEKLRIAFPVRKSALKRVADHSVIVSDASFSLRPDETLGLVGESSSGKNAAGLALLRLIASQGNIVFDGLALRTSNRHQLLSIRYRIQVAFQGPSSSLNPRLSVLQVIEEGLHVRQPTLSAERRKTQMKTAMEEVGLDSETRHRCPMEFSSG